MHASGNPAKDVRHDPRWRRARNRAAKAGLILLGFSAFFLLLLFPIPSSGAIFGTVDTLFGPALSNTYLNRIKGAVLGQPFGQAMYPADIARYGETGIGSASIFMFFRVLGANDTYSLYLTQVTMLSLMAWATALLARLYTGSQKIALFVALIFCTSNFVWADIDHLPIHFYFFPLISAYCLKRAVGERKPKLILAAGVAGGLQMYFSVQVFIYQSILLGVIVLTNLRDLLRSYQWHERAYFAGTYVLIPMPLFLFYLNTVLNLGVIDVFSLSQWEEVYTLQLSDFFKTLPNKLFMYPFAEPSAGGWPRVAHSAFVGLATPALAIFGVRRFTSDKLELTLFGALGVLFSLGRSIEIAGTAIPSPLVLFYKYVPLSQYLRVELRSYSLALLAMSVLAGMGWLTIADRLRGWHRRLPSVGLVAVTLFIAVENFSWPLNVYELKQYPAIPRGYVAFFENKPDARILDLPSNSTDWPDYIDEIIYVIWQTKHKRDILGGVTGHFPPSRLETQRNVDLLPSDEAFDYFEDLGVTHFVWHDSPFLVCHIPHSTSGCDPETGERLGIVEEGYSWLNGSESLQLVYRDEMIRIYELRYRTTTTGALTCSVRGSDLRAGSTLDHNSQKVVPEQRGGPMLGRQR